MEDFIFLGSKRFKQSYVRHWDDFKLNGYGFNVNSGDFYPKNL